MFLFAVNVCNRAVASWRVNERSNGVAAARCPLLTHAH